MKEYGPCAQPTIDHVGLVVPNLTEAIEFFQTAFNASIIFEVESFIDTTGVTVGRLGAKSGTSFALGMLEIGGKWVEVLQWWPCHNSENYSTTPVPNICGAAHIAIDVPDIEEKIANIKLIPGVTVISEVVTFTFGPTPGLRNVFFYTPWGLLIELITWPTQ